MRSGGGVPLAALLLGLLLQRALGFVAREAMEDFYGTGVYGGPEAASEHKKEVKRVQPPDHDTGCESSDGVLRCLDEDVRCLDEDGQCACVGPTLLCDGHFDCPEGEDERNCPEVLCPAPKFTCANGKCISDDEVCDSIDNCGDESDERICGLPAFKRNCTGSDQFNCTNGDYCISVIWLCDGDFDCQDKSDEENCTSSSCGINDHHCGDGNCILSTWLCDGEPDCSDGSDELFCNTKAAQSTCGSDQVACATEGRCVLHHYACDGEDDCGDWSDEHNCNVTTCYRDDYRCESGMCIDMRWVCDGVSDCEGGEDEAICPHPSTDMQPGNCPANFVWCPPQCIAPEWKCDGKNDCPDGTDEADCEVTCGPEHYKCQSSVCIPEAHLCDGHQHCLHGDDETDCKMTVCNNLSCTYTCKDTADTCLCKPGYTLAADNTTCMDVDECSLFRPCSQLCENSEGSFRCSCVVGYSLRPDSFTCKAQGTLPRLIFANRADIREINIDGRGYTSVAKGLQNAISIDYHYNLSLIFWTDVSLDAIMRAFLNGSGEKAIVRWGLRMPSGIAVDWVNDHVYWLDSVTRRIEVSHLDGSCRRPLVWTNLQKPRALLLHPARDLLVWTDWGSNPRIERAYLDGSERQVIIGEGLHWPNGITIDYPTETLYWVDAKEHVIEAAQIDGTNRRKILEGLPHPYAITVFEDYLYWTDWHTRSIHTANKRTGHGYTEIHTRLAFPMDIHSMHRERQPVPLASERRGCSLKNGGCSHLCLPGHHTYACYCPHGLLLLHDLRTCSQRPDRALVFAQRNNLRMISLDGTLEGSSSADMESLEQPRMDTVVPVDGVKSAVALDFYTQEDLIYWTDIEAKTISRAHLNGSAQVTVVRNNLELPGGVAVDWVTDKLYWTDAGTKHIEVSYLDGSMRSLLIWQHLDKPRDIVVDPKDGYMFWTDWGKNAKIERAAMGGGGRKVIVSTNLQWPNGLAIDHGRRVLYWLDASSNTIETANLDGANRKPLIKGELSHPFGLALWEDLIFWSDWDTKSIHLANKLTGGDRQAVVKGLKGLMDVRVFQHNQEALHTPCHDDNGGCSHLCLLSPRPAGYTCACPTGIRLKSDQHTCHFTPEKSLVFARREDIRQMSLDTPYQADVILPLIGLQHVVALDIDPVSGDIFLPDSAASVIYRASLDGGKMTRIVYAAIDNVQGIAVDATGRKMYWTDMKRQSVEVSELDGGNRRVLFTGLDRPRAITTHYPSGKLFWTDWDENYPRIEVADMDGSNRQVLVDTNVAWPNGLSVDWQEEELYWTDAKTNVIHAIGIDGRNRRTVVTNVPHPYGVTVQGKWVYWTDWETKSLNRTQKDSRGRIYSMREGLAGLMDIKALPGPPVEENKCGDDNGRCSHLCLRIPLGYSCACPTGLTMIKNDNHRCKEEPNNYLIVAAKGMLARISLDTEPLWDVPLYVSSTSRPIDVDFHKKKNLLFYTDTDLESIRVVSLKNLSHPWTIITPGYITADGLALDWLADNIYWTDTGHKTVEVARLDGSSQKTIINSQLLEPRAIALFPSEGLLFWTDWGNNSKIERAYLDGSQRTVLIDQDIGWPNGITIDYKMRRIFWNDAKFDTIGSSDLNGENRVVLLQQVSHPFGLTLLGSHIYWTDWETMTIERADKTTGKNRKIIRSGIEGIMEIKAVTKTSQEGWNQCVDRNGGCSHLCFYLPSGRRCACPDNTDPECSDRPLFKVPSKPDLPKKTPKKPGGTPSSEDPPGLVPLLAVLALVFAVSVLAMMAVVAWWKYKKQTKMVEGPKGGALTYTNPTYSASNSDVNTDRKPFTWRRLHHEANHQGRMFEEKGEVAALISEGSSVEHESPPPTPPTRPDPVT
ncbi:low-density lipoprotein receptor-related protein 4 isoform X2 [Procambarus clarkii]|uniref:low-density lipoprotein receptor-related protein 4 isoform X2 n=1 Tax=Procambarus clarkii TaxID=6728 RepID=UPI003743A37D